MKQRLVLWIALLLLLATVSALASTITIRRKHPPGGGGTTPPTLVQEDEIAWNVATTPRTTAGISVTTGNRIVVASLNAQSPSSGTYTITSSPTHTWAPQENQNVPDFCGLRIWSTTATTTGTLTVTVQPDSGAGQLFGARVFEFSGSGGFGAAESTSVASGAPSLAITTTGDNSGLIVANCDWNAGDGASRTWRTINGSTGTEKVYFRNATWYTVYVAYYADAGAAGAKTAGLSAPTGQKYTIGALEVLGQ